VRAGLSQLDSGSSKPPPKETVVLVSVLVSRELRTSSRTTRRRRFDSGRVMLPEKILSTGVAAISLRQPEYSRNNLVL
jgi:hypothetical protein